MKLQQKIITKWNGRTIYPGDMKRYNSRLISKHSEELNNLIEEILGHNLLKINIKFKTNVYKLFKIFREIMDYRWSHKNFPKLNVDFLSTFMEILEHLLCNINLCFDINRRLCPPFIVLIDKKCSYKFRKMLLDIEQEQLKFLIILFISSFFTFFPIITFFLFPFHFVFFTFLFPFHFVFFTFLFPFHFVFFTFLFPFHFVFFTFLTR
jgi:hypothetical protein